MKIAIGVGIISKDKKLPPYVSFLLKTKAFAKQKILVFPYGSRDPNEFIIIKIILLPLKTLFNFFRMIFYRPQIIHLNSAFDMRGLIRDIPNILIFKLLNAKLCIEFHGSDLIWASGLSNFEKSVISNILKLVTHIFVLSTEEKQFFESQLNIHNITRVKNPIDLSTLNQSNFSKKNAIPTLLFVGRVIETKGVSEIIRAIRILKDQGFEMIPHVRIVGDGLNLKECIDMSNNFRIISHISFTGWVCQEKVIEYFINSDVFILPTYHQEGMPIVILYALLYGLPIITTRIRGMADILREYNNCLFVEPKNPNQLAEKIKHVLLNEDLRERMVISNQRLAREFDKEIVAKEFIKIYKSILINNSY